MFCLEDDLIQVSGHRFAAVYMFSFRDHFIPVLSTEIKRNEKLHVNREGGDVVEKLEARTRNLEAPGYSSLSDH